MKQRMMPVLRAIRDKIGRHGYWIRTVRGRDRWRAGVEILWHDIDPAHERVTIASVVADGHEMKFLVRNKDDWIQSHHFRGLLYSEDELRFIGNAYRGGAFVDVGANVGNHSIAAALLFGAPDVIAFEPNSEAFRILRCNIALNDLAERIQHHPFGLSDHDANAVARSPEHGRNLGGTKLIEGEGDLRLLPGDGFLVGKAIGFIKIDVEGGEMAVLRGLAGTIARERPPMLVEVDDANRQEFDKFCESVGYRVAVTARPYPGNENFLIVPTV